MESLGSSTGSDQNFFDDRIEGNGDSVLNADNKKSDRENGDMNEEQRTYAGVTL